MTMIDAGVDFSLCLSCKYITVQPRVSRLSRFNTRWIIIII